MMKVKLSKNSWHYRFWTKCMKSEALYKMFGERVDWYDYEIAHRIPQDLCSYMRNLLLMMIWCVSLGSFAFVMAVIIACGMVVIPFALLNAVWAMWWINNYDVVGMVGVVAWALAFLVGFIYACIELAIGYKNNCYKEGTFSFWLEHFRFPRFGKPKLCLKKAQSWWYVLFEYYDSFKEKTCKKIEFED